jgi:hypothetical protein
MYRPTCGEKAFGCSRDANEFGVVGEMLGLYAGGNECLDWEVGVASCVRWLGVVLLAGKESVRSWAGDIAEC